MARRTKEDANRTREGILSSALDLFLEKGYQRTTFEDVAERLNMTKGAVYWHFETKESLLLALIDRALQSFREMLGSDFLSCPDTLSFPVVADAMIRAAQRTVEDKSMRKFFLLMRTQVRWEGDSMARIREQLLDDAACGPKYAFARALENDKRALRVRAGVNVNQVVYIVLAIWDGLVQAKIDGFLEASLAETLQAAYSTAWKTISTSENGETR